MRLEKQILAGDWSSFWKVVFKGASQESWAGVLGFLCLCHARPPETLGSQSSFTGTLCGGEKWFFPSCILCIFWILVQLSQGPSCLFHRPCSLEAPRLIAPGFYKPRHALIPLNSVSQQAFQAEVEACTRCPKPGRNKYDSGRFSLNKHESLRLPLFFSLCSSAACSLKLFPKRGLLRDSVSISFSYSFISLTSSL